MSTDSAPQILTPVESALLRQAYLDRFVDTKSDHYAKYVATTRAFSDGIHYEGHIWDCLQKPKRITFEQFSQTIMRFNEVYVFADDHSRERVVGAPLWPYAPLSIARFQLNGLLTVLPTLPEDIYLFDTSVSWTLVLTHEYDDQERICGSVGLDN